MSSSASSAPRSKSCTGAEGVVLPEVVVVCCDGSPVVLDGESVASARVVVVPLLTTSSSSPSGHRKTMAATTASVASRPPTNSSAVLARPSPVESGGGSCTAGNPTTARPLAARYGPADVRPGHGRRRSCAGGGGAVRRRADHDRSVRVDERQERRGRGAHADGDGGHRRARPHRFVVGVPVHAGAHRGGRPTCGGAGIGGGPGKCARHRGADRPRTGARGRGELVEPVRGAPARRREPLRARGPAGG